MPPNKTCTWVHLCRRGASSTACTEIGIVSPKPTCRYSIARSCRGWTTLAGCSSLSMRYLVWKVFQSCGSHVVSFKQPLMSPSMNHLVPFHVYLVCISRRNFCGGREHHCRRPRL